jgi:hypothetical protein
MLIVAPATPLAELACAGDENFVGQCQVALEDSRTTSPAGAAVIERLENSSNPHVILPASSVDEASTSPISQFDAYDTASGGSGVGTGTFVTWAPLDFTPIDGAPGSPHALLLHELWHANIAEEGGMSSDNVPGTQLDRDEIDATIVENQCRQNTRCGLRESYGRAGVPLPFNMLVPQNRNNGGDDQC